MNECRSIQISLYHRNGDISPTIVEDLPRMGVAPDAILKAKATRLLNKHANGSRMEMWKRLHNSRELYRRAGAYEVVIHKLSLPHN